MKMFELPVAWDNYHPISDGKAGSPYVIYDAFRNLIDHIYDVRPKYTKYDDPNSKSCLDIATIGFKIPPQVYNPYDKQLILTGYYELTMFCKRNRWAEPLKPGIANSHSTRIEITLYSHPTRVTYDRDSIKHYNKLIQLFEDYTEIDVESLTGGEFHYL